MNRKSIINENLEWPEINEQNSQNIIKFLGDFFAKESGLRRKKTMPKKLRKLKNKTKAENKLDFGLFIKSRIKIGINSISKSIEKNPSSLAFVLVCRSCKPLTVLTRHIQVMCSISNISAGCVHNLNSLAKIFNIKTVSALGILRNTELNFEPNEHEKLFSDFLNDIQKYIIPLLPPLKNPFTSINLLDSKILIDDVNNCLVKVDLNRDKKLENSKEMHTFGSDFISINESNICSFINFDNNNFILIKDEDEDINFERMEE